MASQRIGYARISTADQSAALQEDALRQAGCERVYVETASGAKADRPQLNAALDHARAGDTIVVWRLDRLGRSLPHLLEVAASLEARGIGLRSLTEQLDTTSAGGRLIFAVLGAIAAFERDLIRERTQAGLAAARARGRRGGRRPALTGAKLENARVLYAAGRPIDQICQTLGIGRSTLYRALAQKGDTGGRR